MRKLLILLIIMGSCISYSDEYSKKISVFDDKIKNHFPGKPSKYYTLSIYGDVEHDVTTILLLNKYDQKEYNILRDSLKKLSKISYKPSDSCLLVVNMYTDETNWFKTFKTKNTAYLNKECLKDKLPIPNFWSLNFKTNNIAKLPNDYNIYVFDASHDTINKKYLSYNVYMPDYWKHGYSKGVAMNDKTHEIIYWFVLW